MIASIAHGAPYVDFNENIYPYLNNETDRRIYEYALDKFKSGVRPSVSALYSMFDRREVNEIVEYGFLEGDDAAKYAMCLNRP